jgi:hypothetical protein
MTNGLTREQAADATRALEIEDTLGELLDATTDALTARKVERFELITPRGSRNAVRQQALDTKPQSWVKRWDGGITIGYGSDAKGGRADSGQLEFWVGIWFEPKQTRALDVNESFRRQLKEGEFAFEFQIDDDGCFIGIGCPASEFIKDGRSGTMDSQAKRVADWMHPRLEALLHLNPGRRP